MTESTQCKHEGCNCDVPKERAATGEGYCSDYCKKHGEKHDHVAHACGCGHPSCAG
jgi:hypothetical protein